MPDSVDDRFAQLEARSWAHGVIIKILVAVAYPDRAQRFKLRDEVCDALDRVQELVDAYASGVDAREQGRGKREATAALPALPEAD